MAYAGPLPTPTEETEGFWQAAQQGVFTLHRCTTCGTWYWPASACRKHDNAPFLSNMRWEPASGRGTVFAHVIARRTFHPAFPAPFVYALIKLDEGPLFPCAIDIAPEQVRVGLPVRAEFVTLSPEFKVPRFVAL